MRVVHTLITSLVVILIIGCKAKPAAEARKDGFTPELKTKEDSLFHEVMEGHDEGMAKMSKISKYLTLIQKNLDSISKLPTSKIDETHQQALIDLQEDLNYADYGMNMWMTEFSIDSGKGNQQVRLKYLESEKVKVNEVRKSILASLARADSLFGKK